VRITIQPGTLSDTPGTKTPDRAKEGPP